MCVSVCRARATLEKPFMSVWAPPSSAQRAYIVVFLTGGTPEPLKTLSVCLHANVYITFWGYSQCVGCLKILKHFGFKSLTLHLSTLLSQVYFFFLIGVFKKYDFC